MKDRYLILFSFVILICQTTFFPFIEIGGIHPSLSLIFLISGTVIFGHWKGLRLAIYLGGLFDLTIGRGLGVYVFEYLIISYVISSLEEKIFKDNFITPIILFVSSSVFEVLYFTIYEYILSAHMPLLHEFVLPLFIYSAYNTVLGLPIYIFLMRKYIGYSVR